MFVITSDKLPVVSMQLAIKAGRIQEPHARLGVSEFAADLLVKGTTRHDALAIAKQVDFVGGTLASESTFEATLVSCSVLARDRRMCLDLLPEIVTQPSFPQKELDAVRDKLIANARQRLEDAGVLASLHVQNLLWGNEHVRGWINSERTIGAVTRDDVVAWHKTWFVPANAMLVVTGDVDARKLKGDLERTFGAWKKGPVPPSPTFQAQGLSGSRIRLVDKPGQTQTHIRIAQFGIAHDDPRFFDTLVWNYVLGGGGFSSRLMRVVRVEGGKTYGATSSFDRNLDQGSFVASTFTRNSEAVSTTKLVLAEIARMAKAGPTQDEVDAAIANIAGGYGLRFQSAADLGGALIGAELHGFGREYLANFPLAVGKVDVTSAAQAAAAILDPRAYVIVMVGDAKDLEPQLKAEGWRYEKVAYTEPISPEVKEVAKPADPKAIAAMQQLVAEALVVKGGRAKLEALKGLKMSASGSTAVQGQNVPVEIERIFLIPDKIRIDATLTVPGGQKVPVIVSVLGQTGWQLGPNPKTGASQIVDIQKQDLGAIDFERWREPELILLKASAKDAKVTPLADEMIDGKANAVLLLASPYTGLDVKVYLDRKTKLVTRIGYTDGPVTNTDDFADYKTVGDLQIAHKRTQSAGGRITTLTVAKVELDPTVPDSAFAKPATP
ncbi:MAG: pitrilysin family protein [Proteobacteria bacterium]|nr:pitrilysin family protein [Pseudomonadota bacterium]